ncbi:MAG: ATP-binding response regulator [Tepidisphaeraceae bacterium]
MRASMRQFAVTLALPIAAVAAAAGIRVALTPILGPRQAFVTFYPAVLAAAIYGGALSGLLATGLSALTVMAWLAPAGHADFHDSADLFGLLLFIAVNLLVVWLCHRESAAHHRADLAVDALHLGEQRLRDALAGERGARADAESASRTKDEFLATLSHELRTPLNAILGWSQLLLRSPHPSTDDLAQGLATIERNARAQTQIIESLLDMSRIVSGRIELDVKQVELCGLVEAAMKTARPAAIAKRISLTADIDPAGGVVSADPNRLQQILWNLLSNAIKFTPAGGRVRVSLERVDGQAAIAVQDTGQGIRTEFLPHVFERFRQADGSTTRTYGGLGLGLSIVRHLVELHGGTVRAASAGPGLGATFTVALPLSPADAVEDEPALGARRFGDSDSPRLQGVKVLVVDDEPDARALVKRVLEDCGAQVETACSAREGMNALRRMPHVLVSDIGMPEEDGYDFVRRLRTLTPEQGGSIPAVALTAYARSEDRTRALLSGYQMHVSKPVEPSELAAVVASLAGRASAQPS